MTTNMTTPGASCSAGAVRVGYQQHRADYRPRALLEETSNGMVRHPWPMAAEDALVRDPERGTSQDSPRRPRSQGQRSLPRRLPTCRQSSGNREAKTAGEYEHLLNRARARSI